MAFKMKGFSAFKDKSPVYKERKDGKVRYYKNDGTEISPAMFTKLNEEFRNRDRNANG
jgi:hypothetical protein|tara:strand:+ start:116 stop:289 length:174 start_codon:yes stop_codon:yes gene_type:complete